VLQRYEGRAIVAHT